jgi:hypothetical protein
MQAGGSQLVVDLMIYPPAEGRRQKAGPSPPCLFLSPMPLDATNVTVSVL